MEEGARLKFGDHLGGIAQLCEVKGLNRKVEGRWRKGQAGERLKGYYILQDLGIDHHWRPGVGREHGSGEDKLKRR